MVAHIELFNHAALETAAFEQCEEALLCDFFDRMNSKALNELALLLSS